MRRPGRALAALGVALGFAACGDDERLGGAAFAPDAGSDVSAPDAQPDAPPDTGPVRRTVIQRNPFGNVGASDNLLWDGDFEWHSAFASQYGWVNAVNVISAGGFSGVVVGPQCRSGMKCGRLTQNQKVAGIGVSPSDQPVRAGIWSKPSTGECLDVRVLLIACDYGDDLDVPVLDADGKPDADGWCEHVLITEERQRASCLLVEAQFQEGEAIIDDAIIQPAPAGMALSPSPPLSAAARASAEAARAGLREWLKPGRAREPDARRAWERFRRRAR